MTTLNLDDYFGEISELLTSDDVFTKLQAAKDTIEEMNKLGGRILLAGNGGSAGIVSHAAVDFTKQAKVPALTFNEPGIITAFSNDYGYEFWVEKAFEFYAQPSDVLILVSVSGTSQNLVNAANLARSKGHRIITFTGKNDSNALRQIGDINFWVNSHAYNIVEGIHMLWLTSIVDLIIGKSVYDVS